jgi:hypothetical protein
MVRARRKYAFNSPKIRFQSTLCPARLLLNTSFRTSRPVADEESKSDRTSLSSYILRLLYIHGLPYEKEID